MAGFGCGVNAVFGLHDEFVDTHEDAAEPVLCQIPEKPLPMFSHDEPTLRAISSTGV